MADWDWADGELSRVLHPTGTFDGRRKRFRRAQFDILRWDISGTKEVYVLAPPADSQSGAQESINSAPRDHEAGVNFGYYGVDEVIVDADGESDTTSYLGLHSFGYY